MRLDDSDRVADLIRRVSSLEMMMRRSPVLTPRADFIPVIMTQVGGDDGDFETVATWTYKVETFGGLEIFPALGIIDNPAQLPTYVAPHKWRRPNIGVVSKATFGILVRPEPNIARAAGWVPWALAWCNEVSELEACEEVSELEA